MGPECGRVASPLDPNPFPSRVTTSSRVTCSAENANPLAAGAGSVSEAIARDPVAGPGTAARPNGAAASCTCRQVAPMPTSAVRMQGSILTWANKRVTIRMIGRPDGPPWTDNRPPVCITTRRPVRLASLMVAATSAASAAMTTISGRRPVRSRPKAAAG